MKDLEDKGPNGIGIWLGSREDSAVGALIVVGMSELMEDGLDMK